MCRVTTAGSSVRGAPWKAVNEFRSMSPGKPGPNNVPEYLQVHARLNTVSFGSLVHYRWLVHLGGSSPLLFKDRPNLESHRVASNWQEESN